jgi:hypothetical protein
VDRGHAAATAAAFDVQDHSVDECGDRHLSPR